MNGDLGHLHAPDQHGYRLPYHWCMSAFHQYVIRQAVERVAPFLVDRAVLEVGCGDGFVTSLLARHARSVFGYDINDRAIAFAEMIVQEPHVSFGLGRAGDALEIGRELDPQIDAVASFEVVEHLSRSELDSFLVGVRELLPVAGSLILTTPNGVRRSANRNPHHEHEFAPKELTGILRAAGFGSVRISGLYLQPPWSRAEHFANTVPFRGVFRALARAGARRPERCRTLVCVAQP